MGFDSIHSKFLNFASDDFINNITYFLNACFTHCYIPQMLLKGDISPIIKNKDGNKCDSNNYRPIMQSSCILKILEMHVLEILSNKIRFNHFQFGFVSDRSTTDACFILKETIYNYINNKSKVYANFVDLSKAFDRVDHYLLLDKLIDKGIPPDIIMLLKSYLRTQSARIVWDGHCGRYQAVDQGVRQGGILSPFLFNLYLDDLICKINSLDIGCKLGISRINIIVYADDIVLLADSKHNLEILYDTFNDLVRNLKLKVNYQKCKVMIFNSGRYHSDIESIVLIDQQFNVVSNFKYLGNFLTFNLDDEIDINFKLNSFYRSFNLMYRSFMGMNIEVLLCLFNSLCSPQYGIPLWTSSNVFNKQYFRTFEVAYNNALKSMVGCPRYASSHVTAEICQQLMLRHGVSLVQARYINSLIKKNNPILKMNISIIKNCHSFSFICKYFNNLYNINVLDNPIDIIISRINWTQLHEPRSRYCNFYMM